MQRNRDQALILQVDKFGDTDAIVHFFTESHGLNRGVVKAGLSSKRRAALQPATLVDAQWQARLPEHLGTLTVEASHAFGARVMHDPLRLAAVGSATSLLGLMMAEHDPHPELFHATLDFLKHVAAAETPSPLAGEGWGGGAIDRPQPHLTPPHLASPARGEELSRGLHLPTLIWLAEYVRLEVSLLEQAGFGLDLTRCAATGSTEELIYVSPKSGRAVCREAGAPYHEKMLALPECLRSLEHIPDNMLEITQGLTLTGYFLETRMLPALHRKMPPLRAHFVTLAQR